MSTSTVEDDISTAINCKKSNDCLSLLDAVIEILKEEILEDIVPTIISYLSHTDSTLNGGKYYLGYVLAPTIDHVIPCLVISAPKCSRKTFRYCLSSIKLQFGWFPEEINQSQSIWPKNGKFYCCIQLFNRNMAPHDKSNKILWKSQLYTTLAQHKWEHFEMKNIDLIMEYDKSYLFYVIELSLAYTEDKQYQDAYNKNEGMIIQSLSPYDYWTKSIALPTKNKDDFDELKDIKMITDIDFSYDGYGFRIQDRRSKVYEVAFYPTFI